MRQIATNEPTRYELVIEHADGRRYLLAYRMRKTRRSMIDCLRDNAAAVLATAGLGDDARFTCGKRVSDGLTIGEWRIRFSGRTQRETRTAGELPAIAIATHIRLEHPGETP